MRYAVILAGGSGKRLWPASRQSKPKQLIRLVDGKSLLALAVERLYGLFDPARIMILTNAAYADDIAAHFPDLPRENIVGEPEGRDTANAVALAAELVHAKDPNATLAIFTADHVIRPVNEFQICVERGCQVAEKNPDSLVTFGIRPTYPHTGLGYVHCDRKLADNVHHVQGFKEKPDHHTARHYVESGEYFWNSGMFVWQVGAIRKVLSEFLADSFRKLSGIDATASGPALTAQLAKFYGQLPRISIDYAVMEKAADVLMVELTAQWLDVGSWPSLEQVAKLDADGNAVVAARAVVVDSNRNVIYADDTHLVAVVGMDDCIIVHTADATLVCNKSDSQRLKELVDSIGERFGVDYI